MVSRANVFFSITTYITAEKLTKSLWGLTERAANNLLKWDVVDINDMGDTALRKSYGHRVTRTVNQIPIYGSRVKCVALFASLQRMVAV